MTIRDIRFESFDGVSLEGTLVIPEGGAFDEVVLMIPGIQVNRDEYLGFYHRLGSYLAAEGIASFRIDWRCHGIDSSRALQELTLSGLYNDVEAAASTTLASINQKARLSVVAQSFSGGVAATWASRNDAIVDKCILLAPVLDYIHEYILGPSDGGRAKEGKGNYNGLSAEASRELTRTGTLMSWGKGFGRAIVNEFRAMPISLPTNNCWIIHGDEDAGVDIDTPRKLVSEPEVHAKLVVVPGADHGFAKPGDSEFKTDETKRLQGAVFLEIVTLIKSGTPTTQFSIEG